MGYFSTWSERGESSLRLVVPYGLMALLFFVGTVSFGAPLAAAVRPPLFLMAIYYWAIYRPSLIPAWLVFAAGILMDIIVGLPMGLNALAFVLVQWALSDQRRFLMGQSFLMIWIGFAIVSMAMGIVQWGIFGLLSEAWPSFKSLLFSVIFGVALFPLISALMHLTQKILPHT
ncbi:MAG: rod shape-determining protein MreD, partial [Alphaproteobacteria bacterium]